MNNMFEIASKKKFRYPFKGMITTEDLWDLSMAQLDTVYKALNKDVLVAQEDSLMCKMDTVEAEVLTKIDIVKYIFHTKELEAMAREEAAANAAKKQRIMEVLAQKQDNALLNMSEEELRQMLNELNGSQTVLFNMG